MKQEQQLAQLNVQLIDARRACTAATSKAAATQKVCGGRGANHHHHSRLLAAIEHGRGGVGDTAGQHGRVEANDSSQATGIAASCHA